VVSLLFLLTLAAFSPVRDNGFIFFDDPGYIENRHVQGGLSSAGLRWAFTHSHSSNWHPLTWLSHMLDVELFGNDAGAHHLVNVVLHGLSAVLLLLFLRCATGSLWASAAVAGLFALHPLRVESVAWASERKDVLAGLFFFLTLLLYGHYVRKPGVFRYTLVATSFALGLLSKPMLVTLPAVLLILDRWPFERWTKKGPGAVPFSKLLVEKLPLIILSITSSIATLWAQSSGNAVKDLEALTLSARIANAADSIWLYLGKTIWPTELSIFYPHPALVDPNHHPWALPAIAALLALLVTAVHALCLWRTRPWLPVGWFWYVGTLIPVLGILQVGGQQFADRYTYLTVVGVTLACAFELRARRPHPLPSRISLPLFFVLALALALPTYLQAQRWKNTELLFQHALAVTERNYVAHNILALAYSEAGRQEEAIEQLEARLAISPATGAYINLGTIYAQQGDIQKATEVFEQALTRKPDQPVALANLGTLFLARGDEARARRYLERAVALKNPTAMACEGLAWILVTTRHPNQRDAARALELILRAGGRSGTNTWSFQRTRAAVLAANGDFEAAVEAQGRALGGAPQQMRASLVKERDLYRAKRTL